MESSKAGFLGSTIRLLMIVGKKALILLVRMMMTIYEGGSSRVFSSAFCACSRNQAANAAHGVRLAAAVGIQAKIALHCNVAVDAVCEKYHSIDFN